jgi:long-chain acyl-CoA synthetase
MNSDQDIFDFKFYDWEKHTPDAPFLMQPFGNNWETYSWAETGQRARKLASALLALGLPPKSHIGLISKNCREWVIADLAIMMAGYVSVPFFATLTGNQLNEVLDIGDVKALFVGKIEHWDELKTGIPENMPVIAFPTYKDHSDIDRGEQWEDLLNKHSPLHDVAKLSLDDLWTIVFTSGTTGKPKGVVISFRTLNETKRSTEELNPLKVSFDGNNRFFSFLPLNHIAERIIIEATSFRFGGTIGFSESLSSFKKNLSEFEPTVFFGVPRIWTKFQQGILSKMPQKKLDRMLKIPILSGIIKKKIRKGLGLNSCRAWLSGAAPMTDHQKAWYDKIGVPITDGYGMTETCAIGTVIFRNDNKPGSVGRAQPGVEVNIEEATGEILMKSAYVMSGYYNEPEKTNETLINGWLHTGDQGRIDEDGFLYITGRIKDTFKTSKGKFIVPAPMEWLFEQNENIEQICILGLGCPQPIGILILSEIGVKVDNDLLIKSLIGTLEKVNAEVQSYTKISTLVVTNEQWTVENGLCTPTLKVKRNELHKKFQMQLEDWHDQSENIIFVYTL